MARQPNAVTAAAACVATVVLMALLPLPASGSDEGAAVGVNWGTMMSHPINPSAVVRMLLFNGVNRVKMFDADPWTASAFANTGIQLMLAVPNDQLAYLASDPRCASLWVIQNVTGYLQAGIDVSARWDGTVDAQAFISVPRNGWLVASCCRCWPSVFRYVAVGNEPFLKSYNGSLINVTFPALKSMQRALDEAGLGEKIKAVLPLNADVYNSPENKPVPSAGHFRKDINALMVDIVNFLHKHDAPFVVNIYPFLSLYQNPNFPLNFSFFDGGSKPVYDEGMVYTNVFDANFDTLVWSLRKSGVPDLKIIVEIVGTPLRPGSMEVYLFALIDENQKSVLPGRFERHWGLLAYDGKPKFSMDLSGQGQDNLVGVEEVPYLPAQWCVFNKDEKDKYKDLPASVDYACSNADCTPLGYGSSCNDLSHDGNISYAFNIYFQTMDQDVRACSFGGLAKITRINASQGGCLFPVQILSASEKVVPLRFVHVSLLVLLRVCIHSSVDI
ncbi:hypothetical protein GUJ93_ZPchr0005g15600 [Zizania palustris]|uniref:X8 domain-containing protein n=1 Tax=Zizania palustris TaxID=103762 RepID=A0A8J5T5Q6_ZIZPA|nr:hypothetical protein GUJ93_ZPchr0005g15600 [Zizania palustris]